MQNGGSCGLCCLRSVTWPDALICGDEFGLSAWPLISRPGGATVLARGLSCRASDVRGDDISGVSVQRRPGSVIAHSGSRIGVRSGFLHVPQWHAGVERRSDERMPQRVRPNGLGDPGAASDLADDPGGTMAVQPPTVRGQEDRAFTALADGQVDRPCGAGCERDSDDLAAFAGDYRVRCPRSKPMASMSAPVASETRSPLSASREISACSAAGPSPAATSSAPSSLRSSPVAWDS